MQWIIRLRMALRPALLHLFGSALIALIFSAIVFFIWYPSPYDKLAGGRNLLVYLICVDVILGPLLTLLVYDQFKERKKLAMDIIFIILCQLFALGYGLFSMAMARPVYLAYEGNRYRLVSVANIDSDSLALAPIELQSLPLAGPKLIGVRLSESADSDFPLSIQLSMAGLHPAFRPQRWVTYASQLNNVQASLMSVATLMQKRPAEIPLIDAGLKRCQMRADQVGYLPLSAEKASPVDWVVLVGRSNGYPCAFLPIDGW